MIDPESPVRSIRSATLYIGDTKVPVTQLEYADRRDNPIPSAPLITSGSLTFEHTWPMPRATTHALALHIARAFRVKLRDLGIDLGCACHPLPNPAGRDYRRRTKHRNRRKR